MPEHNVLVTGALTQTGMGSAVPSQDPPSRSLVVGVGPVHLTIIGLVVASIVGLIVLHKAGFRFSVTVGGR